MLLCYRYRKLLIPYYEGDLNPDAVRKVERHLAKCSQCRTELDAIRLVAGALGGADVPPAEPANDLWARVSAQIAEGSPQTARRDWFVIARGFGAGIAAAVVVGAIGIRLLAPVATHVATIDARDDSQKRQASATVENTNSQRPAAKVRTTEITRPAPTPQVPGKDNAVSPRQRPTPRAHRWFAHRPAAPHKPSSHRTETGDEVALGYGESAVRATSEAPTESLYDDLDRSSGATIDVKRAECAPAVTRSAPVAETSASKVNPTAVRSATSIGGANTNASDAATAVYANIDATPAAPVPSVVDDLNETEGVRTAAIFSYP